jgi:hypothetical protein
MTITKTTIQSPQKGEKYLNTLQNQRQEIVKKLSDCCKSHSQEAVEGLERIKKWDLEKNKSLPVKDLHALIMEVTPLSNVEDQLLAETLQTVMQEIQAYAKNLKEIKKVKNIADNKTYRIVATQWLGDNVLTKITIDKNLTGGQRLWIDYVFNEDTKEMEIDYKILLLDKL